jgi:hypothetical protein
MKKTTSAKIQQMFVEFLMKEGAVELALRLAGTCGPPGPRTVGAAAREFDL